MANYDIITFLEYYESRSSVFDSAVSKRTPTNQWQNFFQTKQQLGSSDSESDGDYLYLAFDCQGFGSTVAASIGDLSVSLAATAQIVDITNSAIAADNLIVASLYIQDAGKTSFHNASAQRVSFFIGTIEQASLTDTTVEWTVNPAINKLNPQVPTRLVTEDMMGKFLGR